MEPTARLLHAWRKTSYVVDTAQVLIGRRSPAMDALLTAHGARAAVFVTAWNPMSHPMPVGRNRRMQERLRGRLRRYVALPAEGSWRRWREEHVLVFADPRIVFRVARQFHQAAVVVLRCGHTAALMTSFPVFSPRNSIPNASGAFSSPSTI